MARIVSGRRRFLGGERVAAVGATVRPASFDGRKSEVSGAWRRAAGPVPRAERRGCDRAAARGRHLVRRPPPADRVAGPVQILVRPFLFGAGWLMVALATAGLFLPLLPTTPFLLVAAWCFDRSSPRVHAWLLRQPGLGPLLADWRAHGVVRLPTKWIATALLLVCAAVAVMKGDVPAWALGAMGGVIASVLVYLWTRPSRPRPKGAPGERPALDLETPAPPRHAGPPLSSAKRP
jgi:uncharacterized protein